MIYTVTAHSSFPQYEKTKYAKNKSTNAYHQIVSGDTVKFQGQQLVIETPVQLFQRLGTLSPDKISGRSENLIVRNAIEFLMRDENGVQITKGAKEGKSYVLFIGPEENPQQYKIQLRYVKNSKDNNQPKVEIYNTALTKNTANFPHLPV